MPKRTDTEASIRSKLSKRSNGKGNKGELQVAKLLGAWWQPIDPNSKFVRVPRSGGWVYGPDFGACGDIMAKSNPPFVFAVEVKRIERWLPANLFAGKPSPVWEWWRQCQYDAARIGKEPMLWFRKNRQDWAVLLRRDFVSSLKIEPPHHAWPDSLRMQVDCVEIPVFYWGKRLIALPPETFLQGGRASTNPNPNQTRPIPHEQTETETENLSQEKDLGQAQAGSQTPDQEIPD